MTRFELAARLSGRLYMLPEDEKHSIINSHVENINQLIEQGMPEADAVEQLGDIDLLADRILLRHHIDPQTDLQEDAESYTVKASQAAAKVVENIKSAAAQGNEAIKDAAEKTAEAAKNTAEAAAVTSKKAAENSAGFMHKRAKNTTMAAARIFNLLIFIIVWMPCMAVTALGVICTSALTVLYLFSGIGFMGICIAGAGCCLAGVSFCLWLGNMLTGGKKNEQTD